MAPFRSVAGGTKKSPRDKHFDDVRSGAKAWLQDGFSLQVVSPLDAVMPLLQAIALGSDEAMTWLGLTTNDAVNVYI